jgi:transcriptional regulator GlxA family with amidase domain
VKTHKRRAASVAKVGPRSVVMLVYPGIMTMDVVSPLEAFAAANTETRQPLYRLTIASMAAEPVETSLGIRLFPSVAASRIAGPVDTPLVSGGSGQARTNPALLKWLRIQGARRGAVASRPWIRYVAPSCAASGSRPSATANASVRRGFRCLPRR